ncbi:KEOPS complex Pcc1-like subunit [Halorussus vallis]|uniref:KEOPS complex subunit Pcc1 n=2 Tax=Halorussus TaxID=1070314 RepID=UPI0020A1D4B0|nr:KEOPS complex subunit Pcc1 [Halorussus vallis]USZ75536.1 KEOPS complex Pcc1-like subunit [Halorussus vallis]
MTEERREDPSETPSTTASRSARIRTELDRADVVAAAVRPDNTPEIDTRVEAGESSPDAVVTTVERETTGGLQTTVDDYVVNLTVARKVVQAADRHANTDTHQS